MNSTSLTPLEVAELLKIKKTPVIVCLFQLVDCYVS